MQIFVLDEKLHFPPVHHANEDGLLAIGGHITADAIVKAYKLGIFPWYNDDVPLWWSPDPRFVLHPDHLKISKSMKAVFKKGEFEFKQNTNFHAVISQCQHIKRKDQDGSWINDDIISAYYQLFLKQKVITAETYYNNQLVGGLYGVLLGNIFFGESMFSLMSNASKFAFIHVVDRLKQYGIKLIDCQVYTSHLESLGASFMPRKEFIEIIKHNT